MQKISHIDIETHRISFKITYRKKQKNIRFISHQDGTFIVSVPWSCPKHYIDDVVAKNIMWIKKNVVDHKKNVTVDADVVRHMKKKLKPIIESKLMQFNSYYNFQYKRISIRHQKTRWGSCSSDGTLSFNCKLMCVSNSLKDYVIVHELCHLKEMNHSKNFWNLVEKTIPDYKQLRRTLKKIMV